jgi:methylglyoxal synthase
MADRLLVKFNEGKEISVMDLINLCSMQKIPINTKVSIADCRVKSILIKEDGSIHLMTRSDPAINKCAVLHYIV